jgi:hypothetical protein
MTHEELLFSPVNGQELEAGPPCAAKDVARAHAPPNEGAAIQLIFTGSAETDMGLEGIVEGLPIVRT